MEKFQATLMENQVTSNTSEAYTLNQKSKFGEKLNQKILYSLSEAFYLVEENKLKILNSKNKILTEEKLIKKFARIDKNFISKYTVFKDLRKKGYIPKTALKFGADFRVYEKSNSHSKWLCYVTHENHPLKWSEFAAKNRVAHSTKKNLLIGIIDEENQVSYYEIKWIKP